MLSYPPFPSPNLLRLSFRPKAPGHSVVPSRRPVSSSQPHPTLFGKGFNNPFCQCARVVSNTKEERMDYFEMAKTVKLRSHHGKYLWGDYDECAVFQSKDGTKPNVKWTVEPVGDGRLIRLKSCYDCYLTASDDAFLLGMTGKKVLQMKPLQLDSSVEWEPIRDGFSVKLKTRYGNYLRANGSLPPWRNSVTHDIPQRAATKDWILWEVEVVEKVPSDSSSPGKEILTSQTSSLKPDGRIIHYTVGDENGEVSEELEWSQILFKGHNLQLLTERLKEETGIHEDIVICLQNSLNNKLYPIRLQLPPNNAPMHIVVVLASSKIGQNILDDY